MTFKNPEKSNISTQIRYIKVLTALCKTKKYDEPVVGQQLQIMNRIIYYENNVPLWFGINRGTKNPFVSFPGLQGENSEMFITINPRLKDCGENGNNIEGIKKFDIIFDMYGLTKHHNDGHEDLTSYFEYISAVLDLYGALCAGRNTNVISSMRERIGLTNKLILNMTESDFREQDYRKAHPILKAAFLRIAKTLVLDYTPYNQMKENSVSNNRCYFWWSVKKSDPSRTIFGWEKVKYGERNDGGHGITIGECEKTVRKLRQVMIDYFQSGTNEL